MFVRFTASLYFSSAGTRPYLLCVCVFFFSCVSVTGDDDKFLLVRVDTANSAIVHNAMGKQKHTHTLISRFVDCMEYTL